MNVNLHDIVDLNNDTPLHVTITSRHEDLAIEIFESLTDQQKIEIFKIKNKLEKNILHLALNQNLKKLTEILFNFYKLHFTPSDFWPNSYAKRFYFSTHPLPHLVPEFDPDQITYQEVIVQTPAKFVCKGLLCNDLQQDSPIDVVIKASISSEMDENQENEIMHLSLLDYNRCVVPLHGVVQFKNREARAMVLSYVGNPINEHLKNLPINEQTFKLKVQIAIK